GVPLDLLHPRQPGVGRFDGHGDGGADRGVRGQRGGRTAGEAVPGGGRGGGVRGEHDQGGGGGAPGAGGHGVRDQRAAGQHGAFDAGGGDVLAARGDDDLFLAAGDRHVPVRVDAGQVAGVQPAAGVDGAGGAGRVVVVAAHHGRAAEQQFAVAGQP